MNKCNQLLVIAQHEKKHKQQQHGVNHRARHAAHDSGRYIGQLSTRQAGSGRDLETRMAMGRTLFDILIAHLQPILASRGLAISFEMRELEEHVKFNHRNI